MTPASTIDAGVRGAAERLQEAQRARTWSPRWRSSTAASRGGINALVWPARTAVELGAPLRAGDVILSGALGPMTPVAPGAQFTAELSGLGSVRARFTQEQA